VKGCEGKGKEERKGGRVRGVRVQARRITLPEPAPPHPPSISDVPPAPSIRMGIPQPIPYSPLDISHSPSMLQQVFVRASDAHTSGTTTCQTPWKEICKQVWACGQTQGAGMLLKKFGGGGGGGGRGTACLLGLHKRPA
jgi:hypothetical protein